MILSVGTDVADHKIPVDCCLTNGTVDYELLSKYCGFY